MPFNLEWLLSTHVNLWNWEPHLPATSWGSWRCGPECLQKVQSSSSVLCGHTQSMSLRKAVMRKCSLENSIWSWSTLLAQLGYSHWLSKSEEWSLETPLLRHRPRDADVTRTGSIVSRYHLAPYNRRRMEIERGLPFSSCITLILLISYRYIFLQKNN
jgi:hypothetical protein